MIQPGAAVGLGKAYPSLQMLLDSSLYPSNKSQVLRVEDQCVVSTVTDFAFNDPFSYFKNGSAILNEHAAATAINDTIMGQLGVPKYCAAGANWHFTKEAFGEHIVVALTGAAAALSFLIDRFDGKALPAGCSQKTVLSSAIEPSSLSILDRFVYNDVVALLDQSIGPSAWTQQKKASQA